MADPKTCCVIFLPEQAAVSVQSGTTILTASRKVGIPIDSLCGGDGVCGKCKVIVHKGRIAGGTSSDLLTRDEIRNGVVLACLAHVRSDLEVEIPEESRVRPAGPVVTDEADRFVQPGLQQRSPARLDPLVKKYFLELSPPSLENNTADHERLIEALRRTTGREAFQMGLKVVRRLPPLLRENHWKITATVAHRGELNEITDLEPGDTTARNFAFAVDVGTTTVVAHLIDLRTGQTLGATARYNSQATYGGDVIRRIMWATNEPDGLAKLQSLIVTDINELIHILLNRYHVARGDVSLITAAGNTTMLHMLLGVDPAWIRREPYVGAIYHPPPFRAAEVGLQISPRGLLYCLPSISSYVGADITAGVLATGGHESEKLYLLVDIGTNGEIVVGNRDWSVCASASAGPAFEGTDTRHGMRAARGAIDHVHHIECRRPPSYSTIDSAPPIGICGTGYIDLLAELTRSGLMDKTGRLNVDGECNRIRLGPQEVPEYVLATSNESGNGIDITITQEDIANMVRAKAAIYAAARVLMNSLSLSFEDIREVRMAGAFGNYLNLENAVAIGLLPDLPADRMQFVGNASIHGAKLSALSTEKMQDARTIAAGMTYFELSTDPTFMDEFSAACFFPHTHLEMFPSLNTGK